MSLNSAPQRYRFTPNSYILPGLDTEHDPSIFSGDKQDSKSILKELLEQIKEEQSKLYAGEKKKLLVVIQAMDTGGKDGCVKSVFSSVDPKGIHVECFKKPTAKELDHDFLWRVHKHSPENGMISVFNRSHYEDIIAVRVKNIFPEEVWRKRYSHVVNFEQLLADEGTEIIKIFLNISKGEQKKRLQDRLDNPEKHWKFNPGDLDDRAKWDKFMQTYSDVFQETHREHAPWYIVPADQKWYRNIVVSKIILHHLKNMKLEYPKVSWDPTEFSIN